MPILASSTACNSGTSFTAASTLSEWIHVDEMRKGQPSVKTKNICTLVEYYSDYSRHSTTITVSQGSMVAAQKGLALPSRNGSQNIKLHYLELRWLFGQFVAVPTRNTAHRRPCAFVSFNGCGGCLKPIFNNGIDTDVVFLSFYAAVPC